MVAVHWLISENYLVPVEVDVQRISPISMLLPWNYRIHPWVHPAVRRPFFLAPQSPGLCQPEWRPLSDVDNPIVHDGIAYTLPHRHHYSRNWSTTENHFCPRIGNMVAGNRFWSNTVLWCQQGCHRLDTSNRLDNECRHRLGQTEGVGDFVRF